MKIRQDAWSHEDDVLLAESVLTHIKEGSTQLKAFDEVGDALNRTSAACGFRWNAVVRQKHLKHIDQAKRERKERKRMLSSSYFPAFERPRQQTTYSFKREKAMNETISVDSIIEQLQQLSNQKMGNSDLQVENEKLRNDLQKVTSKLNELQHLVARNKQEHSMIEEDYQSLITIMNRARRMSILEDHADSQDDFRMETNGSLEKLDK
ncbi:prespore-specific regulator [Alkalihalobacillus xiaoxiensis]|uniref:Prespore-specific regulator n=1 Tax=Shouchella xiaoxiensis TaxID=766895 RepID=A0ABS2SR84_9BACI|nr:RsfA family transcriptional regulator [Shouchella xiaoxiensis]MBM7838015.1 prespore-specific regulator [Shouchella xiaoxiensis]